MHPLPHTDFDGAFTAGTVFLHGKDKWRMETAKWGTLVTPTGRLVACDALGPGRVKPFKRTVEPGKYPVDLAWNGSTTCALRIRFSRQKAVRWEPALRVGEKPSKLDATRPPGFGIDSGIAGVFDFKAAQIAAKDEEWSRRLDTGGDHTIELEPKSGAGMVWCYSGYGDGAYPSFWGLDRSGEIAALVLDFLVLVEGVYGEHLVTDVPDKIGTELDDPWFKERGYTAVRLTWSKTKGELRLDYRAAEPLDITLLNARGKPIHRGESGYVSGNTGDPNCAQYFLRKINLRTENRAKLVFRAFGGFRALQRG